MAEFCMHKWLSKSGDNYIFIIQFGMFLISVFENIDLDIDSCGGT